MMNYIRYLSLFVKSNLVNGYKSSSFLTVIVVSLIYVLSGILNWIIIVHHLKTY